MAGDNSFAWSILLSLWVWGVEHWAVFLSLRFSGVEQREKDPESQSESIEGEETLCWIYGEEFTWGDNLTLIFSHWLKFSIGSFFMQLPSFNEALKCVMNFGKKFCKQVLKVAQSCPYFHFKLVWEKTQFVIIISNIYRFQWT